jgi:hypothetical protein
MLNRAAQRLPAKEDSGALDRSPLHSLACPKDLTTVKGLDLTVVRPLTEVKSKPKDLTTVKPKGGGLGVRSDRLTQPLLNIYLALLFDYLESGTNVGANGGAVGV